MNTRAFLRRAAEAPGLSGREAAVSRVVADAFKPLTDAVSVDKLYNVTAQLGDQGPRILITAHQDEIGLTVLSVEKDGCLRFVCSGGVDVRVLPAATVMVHTKKGPLPGVIGAKPPHLLTAEEQKKAVALKDLYIDVGLDGEAATRCVRVGDAVTLTGELVELQGERIAGRAMDDRACVAAMLETARRLLRARPAAQVFFLSASQEEIGSRGASTACWRINPDAAIALDVTHAPTPGTGKWETFPLDKLTITVGPNLHPELTNRLRATAEANHVDFSIEPCGHVTATDAAVLQVSRGGVPTVLIGLPLKYMHTTVELIDEGVVREVGRLIALFVEDLARDWEEIVWY